MNKKTSKITLSIATLVVCVGLIAAITPSSAFAQTSTFTFQGKLSESGIAANGNYQMKFSLFDQASNGNQIGSTVSNPSVNVFNGIFTVNLDFGPTAFSGPPRYLQVEIFSASANAFLAMNPRQPISSAPYAISSLNAITAMDSANLGGVPAGHYIQGTDPRLNDARVPVAGSADYIQNTTTTQALSNFSISGTGKADVLEAATKYNLAGQTVITLGPAGTNNLLLGRSAAPALTTGVSNVAAGFNSGLSLTGGSQNSFFGVGSGFSTASGSNNSFVGWSSGVNSTGSLNSFFGYSAGSNNGTGSNNSALGSGANFASQTLNFATAIGSGATVSTDNTIALGRSNGTDSVVIPGNLTVAGAITGNLPAGSSNYVQNGTVLQPSTNFNISGDGHAGGTLSAPDIEGTVGNFTSTLTAALVRSTNGYYIGNQKLLSTTGLNNIFLGAAAGQSITTGNYNTFLGAHAGEENTTATGNTFVGASAGKATTGQSGNSFFGYQSGWKSTAAGNSFFGAQSGEQNLTGTGNSFFGLQAGQLNTAGSGNSFFGSQAGSASQASSNNSFFGLLAGFSANGGGSNSFFGAAAALNFTSGSNNVVIGASAAPALTTGDGNTIIGFGANAGTPDISNATAIGANATVGSSNSVSIGSVAASTHVGIGTSMPKAKLEIANGDVYINSQTAGIIMQAPDGFCWRVRVTNSGAFTSALVTCPQ
jgi:hypothetical protein